MDPPPASSPADPELLLLEQAVRWPSPATNAIVSLSTLYTATGQLRRGYEYFSARAEESPETPVFLAMAGVFQARMATEIPLLERVAWVEDAIAKLDRAASADPNLPRFLRAATLARLPARFGEAERAVAELDALLHDEDSFFLRPEVSAQTRQALERQAWQALALAYETLARPQQAARAWSIAGGPSEQPNEPLLGTAYSVSGGDGFRFARPYFWSPRSGIEVARGYDFGDIAFVETSAGVVVVDAGTTEATAAAALAAYRERHPAAPIHTVVLTHAHWDHVGGLPALLEPDTEVVAQAGFAEELARVNAAGLDYQWFFGAELEREGREPLFEVEPDRVVDAPTTITVGDTELVLWPVRGGETDDALLVQLPEEGVVFTGDAFMPYLGAPFVGEGDPEGLLDVIALLQELDPEVLVHGHPPLTELYTIENLEPIGRALEESRRQVLEGVMDSRPIADIVRDAPLPELLRDHPDAVLPVFVMRQQFMQRLHRERTGYWQPDLEGIELLTSDQWAEAIDLVADGQAEPWERALMGLVGRGDHAMAWRLAEHAVRRHPESASLQALRRRALDGLRSKYQQFNPFKLIVFSELAAAEVEPLGCEEGSPC